MEGPVSPLQGRHASLPPEQAELALPGKADGSLGCAAAQACHVMDLFLVIVAQPQKMLSEEPFCPQLTHTGCPIKSKLSAYWGQLTWERC